MPIFLFSERGLGIVSPSHFAYEYPSKMFHMLLLAGQISLSDCLYFLRYWAICVLQVFVNQSVASKQKFKHLENEKSS